MSTTLKSIAILTALAIAGAFLWWYASDNTKQTESLVSNYGTSTEGASLPTGSRESGNENITNTTSATHVIIKTNKGEIELELWRDAAPKTVANFEKLAKEGFYDGTKFHRVIKDFMIQGGDPLSKDDSQRARWGTGGPGYQFADEFNANKLVKGVLAMANAGPDTNGSQFFIITAAATPWLDGKHTGFGRVVRGMEVVESIGNAVTVANDQPKENIVVEKVIVQ